MEVLPWELWIALCLFHFEPVVTELVQHTHTCYLICNFLFKRKDRLAVRNQIVHVLVSGQPSCVKFVLLFLARQKVRSSSVSQPVCTLIFMGVTWRTVCQTFTATSNYFSLSAYNACSHAISMSQSKTYDTTLESVTSFDHSICCTCWFMPWNDWVLAVPLT